VRISRVERGKKRRKKNISRRKVILGIFTVCIIAVLIYIFIEKNLHNTAEAETVAAQVEKDLPEEVNNTSSEGNTSEPQEVETSNKISYGNYTIEKSNDPINSINFSYVMNDKNVRPTSSISTEESSSYNSIFIGKDIKNLIYLTFNENSITSRTSSNLDVLANRKIKATFFVNKEFIEKNPTLVKRMVDEGHIVGVTLSKDINIVDLATNDPVKIINEISMVEESFKNVTGKDITKLFRFPEGTFCKRALNYINQLGYKSIFWSYTSFDKGDENTKDRSLQLMKAYYHQGAIYALNGSNVGCAEALDNYITFLAKKKYKFDLVTNI